MTTVDDIEPTFIAHNLRPWRISANDDKKKENY